MAAPVRFAPCSEPVLSGADFVQLNAAANGNPDFDPLVIKAAYAFGTMLDIFESVSTLLRHERAWLVTYWSAFGVFASAVELLGRCLSGNSFRRGGSDLLEGLSYVFPGGLTTPTATYHSDQLAQLRHFAAHGQATSSTTDIDRRALETCPRPFGEAIEKYWTELQNDPTRCAQLAKASIARLQPAGSGQSGKGSEEAPALANSFTTSTGQSRSPRRGVLGLPIGRGWMGCRQESSPAA